MNWLADFRSGNTSIVRWGFKIILWSWVYLGDRLVIRIYILIVYLPVLLYEWCPALHKSLLTSRITIYTFPLILVTFLVTIPCNISNGHANQRPCNIYAIIIIRCTLGHVPVHLHKLPACNSVYKLYIIKYILKKKSGIWKLRTFTL